MATPETTDARLSSTSKWFSCNGRQFRHMAKAGLIWLDRNHKYVNSLNVFPVPDGDTGTNMLMTMRSAYGRIEQLDETHVGKVAGQLAQGALMGARGNSGVILSQIWRGLGNGLKDRETFDTNDLAQALNMAADTAYKGVMRPVEGTILTVVREAAAEATDAARKSNDLRFMLERIIERSKQALERTPELLPILKQAGVVDSGGQGFIFILEGMLRYANGQLSLEEAAAAATAPAATGVRAPAQALAVPEGGSLDYPYDVQFILRGRDLDVAAVRDAIDAMGDSTVVVGDETTIKVHIHVKDPGLPLSYGAKLGQVLDVVVENMQEQMEDIIGGAPAGGSSAVAAAPHVPMPGAQVVPGEVAVVAVAAGDGMVDVFRSLGAAFVVNGGQTNNPSTEEIFQAIQDVATDKIVVLPNNKNIILAAEAARDLSPKAVVVVPTRSIPQGIGALLALDPAAELDENAAAMQEAFGRVSTGEITTATRSVTLDGVAVEEGAIIALADGRLCAAGPDIGSVLPTLLEKMDATSRELLTIYFGEASDEAQAEALSGQINELYPNLEIEILPGGQPHYHYILGAE